MSRRSTIARDDRRATRALETRPGRAATRRHGAPRETTTSGEPLGHDTEQRLERRLGHNFADVRVHDDAGADALARELGALALTVGDDIFFRAGRYEPATPAGLHLLAHEAAHTVQQRGAHEPEVAPGEARYDALETQADQAAAALLGAAGGGAAPAAAPSLSPSPGAPGVQLKPDEPGLFNNPSIRNPWLQGGWDFATDDLLGGILDFGSAATTAGSTMNKGVGGVGGVLSPLSFFQGSLDVMDAIFGDNSTGAAAEKGVLGGLNMFSGATGLAGLTGALPSVAGSTTMGGIGAMGAGGILSAGGAVAGAGLGGYALGTHLYNETTVGENAVDSMGWIDRMLTDEGEPSWMLQQVDEIGEAWDEGDVLGVMGNGLQIGGAATLGAIGGLAGGAVDLGKQIGGGISDAASWVGGGISDAAGGVADAASWVGGGISDLWDDLW